MTRLLPLAAVAGALTCVVAVGSAQAAPASGNVLGKLTAASQSNSTVEKAHYRHHRRWWWNKHHHRRYWRHRRNW